MSNVMMAELTWQDFGQKIKENCVVILPVGSTEEHGPHLPLGVDAYIAEGLAKMLAKETNAVVAPTIAYGYKGNTGGGPLFPGTLEMNAETLIRQVTDVLCELAADGVKNIFIMNAHYENEMFLLEAMDLTTREYPDVKIVESAWWDQFTDELIARVFDEVPFPGWAVEHAAIAETSMMQFFRPDLVRMERFVEEEQIPVYSYQISPIKKEVFPKLGSPSTSRSASGEKGEDIMNTILPKFVDIVTSEFSGK